MSEPKSRRIPHPIWCGVAAVLLVLLSVFLLIWLPYHREQVAIREIESLGGSVGTFWDGPGWVPFSPERLSWFDRVNIVILSDTSISDEGLTNLSALANLSHLSLERTPVSDKGLKHLSELNNLAHLSLDNAQITDDGLKHLSGLTNLKYLDLNHTQVTDAGVKELRKSLPAWPDCSISY